MDEGVLQIAGPGVGYDEPKILENSRTCFFKDASDNFLWNTMWVVFAVEENCFFQIFFVVIFIFVLLGFFKLFSSVQK